MEENITIEFVKEWIDKHNLSKGSFDRIMRDLIYNSGHNQIDNPYLRDWLIKNTQKFQDLLPIELNKNQQIVLEWLEWQSKQNGTDPTDSIYLLVYGEAPSSVSTALIDLTKAQQFQVLAAFAEWALEQEYGE